MSLIKEYLELAKDIIIFIFCMTFRPFKTYRETKEWQRVCRKNELEIENGRATVTLLCTKKEEKLPHDETKRLYKLFVSHCEAVAELMAIRLVSDQGELRNFPLHHLSVFDTVTEKVSLAQALGNEPLETNRISITVERDGPDILIRLLKEPRGSVSVCGLWSPMVIGSELFVRPQDFGQTQIEA